MVRSSRVLSAGAAVLAMSALGTPAAASATQDQAQGHPIARNTRQQHLTADPTPVMDKSCVDRRIELAAGHYDWEQWLGRAERLNLHLGAGSYTWEDCLTPKDGYYHHETSLNPDNPDWATVRLEWIVRPRNTATYTWGSSLDPRF